MQCSVKAVNEGKIYENLFNHKSLNDTGGKAPNNVKGREYFPAIVGAWHKVYQPAYCSTHVKPSGDCQYKN